MSIHTTSRASSSRSAPVAGGCGEVARLAVPLVFSLLSQSLMAAMEAALLGHVSAIAQGAVGLAWALLWPLQLGCNWSGIGVQICVAQAYGAQRHSACGNFACQGLYINLLAWAVLVVAGLGSASLIQLSGPDPALVPPAAQYLRIVLLGSLPGLCNLTLVGFFRGIGDSTTPLLVTLLVEGINTLLAVLLIFGLAGCPALGVAGAAYASVTAASVGTLIYLRCFLRRGQRLGFLTRAWLPFDRVTCRRIVHVSWPIGAHATLEMSAWSLFTACLARLGSVEAAAHTIALRVLALAYMAGYGIAVATTTLVGQYLGAENPTAARRSMRSSLILVLGLLGGLGLSIFVWRVPLVRLFTQDPAVGAMAVSLLVYVALFQLSDALALNAIGALRGAGHTRWPMLAVLVLNWGLFIPSVMLVLFVWHGGLLGGWRVALGTAILTGLTLLWRAWRGQGASP